MPGISNVGSAVAVNKTDKLLPQNNNNNHKEVSDKTNSDVAKYAAAGVTALAAIGLATFAILSRKKPNSNIKQNINRIEELTSQKSDLTEKISKLKREIQSEYLEKRYFAREEINGTSFQKKVAGGDKSELKNAYKEINSYEADMAELSKKTREKFKGKLVKVADGKQVYQGGLLDDPDWKEVRKLRRAYAKEYFSGNYDNAQKLGLANEVIKSKLTGQPIMLNGKELPVDDAIRMIKDPKHNNDTIYKYLKDNQLSYHIPNAQGLNLSCSEFHVSNFSKRAKDVIKNYKKIPGIKTNIAKAEELKAKYHDISVELAKETRQSENVKQLKALQAQLKSVSDEINSLQA